MALEYGFGLYDKDKKAYNSLYESLSENDKSFYHNVLPFILMGTDISTVDNITIPSIMTRLSVSFPDILMGIKVTDDNGTEEKRLSDEELLKYLKKFIGFKANVNTLSTSEYIKKNSRLMRQKLAKLTDKDIKNIGKTPVSVEFIKDLEKE